MAGLQQQVLKLADALAGAPLCRLLGRLAGTSDPPPQRPPSPRRILVIRPGGMGDMLLLLPALRLLRQRLPGAGLHIICERRNLQVLHLAGLDTGAVAYDTQPLRCLRRLREQPFDACIDTEQFHHFSAVLARLSRAPVRIGFKINPLRNPLYTHLVDYDPVAPESGQFISLLAPLGIQGPGPGLTGLLADLAPPVPAERGARSASLPHAGAGLLVLHPGASAVYKRWAPGRFVDVALQLRAEYGLGCAIVGDRHDAAAARAIETGIRAGGGSAMSLAGELALCDTAALIRKAALFVGTDSGLAHLAIALDRPAVVLFGATDSRKWGFTDRRRRVARVDLPCSPCSIFGYHKPCRTVACMDLIRPAEVMKECRRVMAG